MARSQSKATKRYFAQVGTELMEFPAEAMDGPLSTSAPVRFFRVTAATADQTFVADGDSWEEAEADVDAQMKGTR